MKVTMPRDELQPVTMARIETATRGVGCRVSPAPDAGRELQPTNPATVQIQPRQPPTPVAALGVRHFPIRESAFLSVTSLWMHTVAVQTQSRRAVSVEQPWGQG